MSSGWCSSSLYTHLGCQNAGQNDDLLVVNGDNVLGDNNKVVPMTTFLATIWQPCFLCDHSRSKQIMWSSEYWYNLCIQQSKSPVMSREITFIHVEQSPHIKAFWSGVFYTRLVLISNQYILLLLNGIVHNGFFVLSMNIRLTKMRSKLSLNGGQNDRHWKVMSGNIHHFTRQFYSILITFLSI